MKKLTLLSLLAVSLLLTSCGPDTTTSNIPQTTVDGTSTRVADTTIPVATATVAMTPVTVTAKRTTKQ